MCTQDERQLQGYFSIRGNHDFSFIYNVLRFSTFCKNLTLFPVNVDSHDIRKSSDLSTHSYNPRATKPSSIAISLRLHLLFIVVYLVI